MSAKQHEIGSYEISVVDDHVSEPRDPADVFPDVSAGDWEPHADYALDREGKWIAQWRGHLIRRKDGVGDNILVDTGMGPGPYNFGGGNGALIANLEAIGPVADGYFGGKAAPVAELIDQVVITHCHGDHIGWNTTHDRHGNRVPTFPSATYHIAKADWDYYTADGNDNEAFDEHVAPLADLGVLNLVSGELEIADGVSLLPTNGHTPGHQCVIVRSDGDVGVITGDLFHNLAQIREQHWCPKFDWRQDLSTASRRWLLWRAMTEGWTVFAGHFPTGRSIGRIVPDDDGNPEWDPV